MLYEVITFDRLLGGVQVHDGLDRGVLGIEMSEIRDQIRITSYNVCYTKLLRSKWEHDLQIAVDTYDDRVTVYTGVKNLFDSKPALGRTDYPVSNRNASCTTSRLVLIPVNLWARWISLSSRTVITSYSIHYTKLYESGPG